MRKTFLPRYVISITCQRIFIYDIIFAGESMKKLSVVLGLGMLTYTAFAKVNYSLPAPYVPGEVLVKIQAGSVGKFLAKKSLLDAEVKQELRTLSGQYFL